MLAAGWGPFITLPCVVTRDPKSGKRNVGMYRMQVYDGQTTGMHWQRQKMAAEHLRERLRAAARRCSRRDAVRARASDGGDGRRNCGGQYCGDSGDGAEQGCARGGWKLRWRSAPIRRRPFRDCARSARGRGVLIAGFLRGKPVELVKCETVDLEVPAHAEIVLEGYVELDELRMEGPFGDHTGFYTMEEEYPVFHITCITHRKEPIYAATIVGKPPMEDAWMGKAVERIFLPLMQADHAGNCGREPAGGRRSFTT